jgi:hypothetical protein
MRDQEIAKLESFGRSGRMETYLDPETLPMLLSELFQMPEDKISAALAWIQKPREDCSVSGFLPSAAVVERRSQWSS